MRSKYDYLESHLKTFADFVSTTPVLSSITDELTHVISKEDKELVLNALSSNDYYDIALPSEDNERASYLLLMLRYFTDTTSKLTIYQKMTGLFRYSEYEKMASEYTDQLFLPLYHYYDERIDDSDLLLYFMLKYKRLSEWFNRDELFRMASVDPTKKEKVLDSDLRCFLMKEGFDYPFSTPHSPLGRPDIVVQVEEKPLPLEIKLFDDDEYGKSYVKKGFTQALHYAEDYHQAAGYLVVFNLSDKLLQFGTEVSDDYFPKIKIQNKTIFVVAINIHPIVRTASQERTPKVVIFEDDYLCSSEEANT